MTKPWIDLIVKIAIEVVDFVANMLKDDKEGKKDEPKGTSEEK